MKRVLFALGAGLAAYEFEALRNRNDGDTISEVVWAANRYPLIPFLAGMVAGHFFWQENKQRG